MFDKPTSRPNTLNLTVKNSSGGINSLSSCHNGDKLSPSTRLSSLNISSSSIAAAAGGGGGGDRATDVKPILKRPGSLNLGMTCATATAAPPVTISSVNRPKTLDLSVTVAPERGDRNLSPSLPADC